MSKKASSSVCMEREWLKIFLPFPQIEGLATNIQFPLTVESFFRHEYTKCDQERFCLWFRKEKAEHCEWSHVNWKPWMTVCLIMTFSFAAGVRDKRFALRQD